MKDHILIAVTLVLLLHQGLINAQNNSYFSTSKTVTNEFAWKLFQHSISNRNAENFILCPVSVQLLLSVLKLASEGDTREQIKLVTNNVEPALLYYVLNPEIKDSEVKSASAIFVDSNEKLNENVTLDIYRNGGDVFQMPFQKQPNSAKSLINKWASDATNGYIPELLSSEIDVSKLKAMIASAVFFRSTWKYKFEPAPQRNFYTFFNEGKLSEYMEITGYFKFKHIDLGKTVDGTMINLPYKDNVYSMMLIIPGHKITLNKFLSKFDHSKFTEMIQNFNKSLNSEVHLTMPKFKVSSRVSLITQLQKMGLVDMFSPSKSKISKLIDSQQSMQISEIIQQSTLEVDEKGTIATSATVSFIVPLSAAEPETIHFVIDKPFIAAIVETATQTPIFISKIAVPS